MKKMEGSIVLIIQTMNVGKNENFKNISFILPSYEIPHSQSLANKNALLNFQALTMIKCDDL